MRLSVPKAPLVQGPGQARLGMTEVMKQSSCLYLCCCCIRLAHCLILYTALRQLLYWSSMELKTLSERNPSVLNEVRASDMPGSVKVLPYMLQGSGCHHRLMSILPFQAAPRSLHLRTRSDAAAKAKLQTEGCVQNLHLLCHVEPLARHVTVHD